MIATTRLHLVPWRDSHREPLAAVHADPDVMWDYGGPINRADSDRKLDRYAEAYARLGLGRMAVETPAGEFLGYTGVMPGFPGHPLGDHYEAGWRFVRAAWGKGYASEAARAAIIAAFVHPDVGEVLAYTGPDNNRSQSVMARLGLRRDPTRDFVNSYDGGPPWRGLTWLADRDWSCRQNRDPGPASLDPSVPSRRQSGE